MNYFLAFLISVVLVSCASTRQSLLSYSANSEAIAEFNEGWVQLMDERNLDASRLKRKIDAAIQKQNRSSSIGIQ
ncbi:MAG: hypothetical protein ABJN95_06270 [Maribacter sp.]|uniref:hypothetical protein n=1 Tax=Maribacter sp. TaxID=1897614 RepID=UPI003298A58D